MGRRTFTLYCEYIHCCGKKKLELGQAESRAAAEHWALTRNSNGERPRLPEGDLIRTCPVRHCPAKLQIPRYGFTENF